MRTEESAEAVILHPAGVATGSVIWLHGLGADGHDFVPIVRTLGLPPGAAIRFVFPHAPVRPITLNNGLPMRGWYDILSLDREGLQDEAGVRASENMVCGFIDSEIAAGIAPRRIVIAGFSQGGAIALHTALRYPQRLAGLLPLSTYLPLHQRLPAEASVANRAIPILMCHGRYDPVLPYTLGQGSCEFLRGLGYTIDWQEYPMQHEVCEEEIERVSRWLLDVLPALD